jgi:hypothetical protein
MVDFSPELYNELFEDEKVKSDLISASEPFWLHD